MPISFPLQPPAEFKTQAVTWRPVSIVAQAISLMTGQRQVQPLQGQYWECDITLPPLLRQEAQAVAAFMTALNGKQGTFYYGPILEGKPLGVATGTPLVKGANQSGQDLITDGWAPSVTSILKAGDFIQIGQSLYRLLSHANSDNSGNATLTVFPNLRAGTPDNAPIITQYPKGVFYLTSDPSYDIDGGQVFSFKFSAREALV